MPARFTHSTMFPEILTNNYPRHIPRSYLSRSTLTTHVALYSDLRYLWILTLVALAAGVDMSMYNHGVTTHARIPKPILMHPPHFLSLVQTFFLGNRTCYFPIHTPHSASSPLLNDFDLFKAHFREAEIPVGEVVESENYREIHQYLCKEGWIAHVAGCTTSKLVALVSLPSADDPLKNVAPALEVLLSNIQAIISKGVFHVRRLLGRRPSYVFQTTFRLTC
jgi:hypothetical protein